MKLDNKVKEDFKIFTCFDTEQAKQYVDTKGYFTNDLDEYGYLDNCYYGTLNVVDNSSSRSYLNKDFSRYFGFFLPEEFVKQKEKEKKYRPFTIYEFEDEYFDIVVFRKKKGNVELHSRYNGYSFSKERGADVLLGCEYFSFEELFNNYELQDSDGNWQPFGVELQSQLWIDARIPKNIIVPYDFINTIKEKFKNDITDYSQECEGTFKIKDGKVTELNLTGVALIPRSKDGVKEMTKEELEKENERLREQNKEFETRYNLKCFELKLLKSQLGMCHRI